MDLREAFQLGRTLIDQHGLHEWELGLDRARRRAGCCYHGQQLISLSAPLASIHSEVEVRETFLHEIAHALVGPGHGHDHLWRAAALKIGSGGERCVSEEAPRVEGHLVGTCPAGHERTMHRRPTRVTSCTQCSETFDPASIFSWSWCGISVRMLPAYTAELVRLADAHPSQLVREQLDLDASLGGGRGHPAVVALLDLRPGVPVRLGPGAGRYAGWEGVVVQRRRTRYEVNCHGQRLTVSPGLLTALSGGE